jgi:hypothetical protein
VNLTVADSDPEARYLEARAALIAYLKHKIEIADWHGGSDACNDLRVLEAEQAGRSAHLAS